MSKFYEFIRKLITNNTGVSIKSFMLLWGAFIATLIVANILGFEWYLLLHTDISYRPDYAGMSLVIGAIGTMVGAVVWGKVKSESYDFGYKNKDTKGTSINQDDEVV